MIRPHLNTVKKSQICGHLVVKDINAYNYMPILAATQQAYVTLSPKNHH